MGGAFIIGLMVILPKSMLIKAVNMLDPTNATKSKMAGLSIPRIRVRKFIMMRPRNAPTIKISPWENWIKFKTPKNRVNPTATRLYITPSIIPWIT